MANLGNIQKTLEQESNKSPENKDNRLNRKVRVPIGTPRGKLEVRGKEEGFHYAWINDHDVDARIEEGYEFVTHNVSVGTRSVAAAKTNSGSMCVTLPVGAGVTGYLMRIPQDYYDEDMKKYHKDVVDKTEETMKTQLKSNSLTGTLEIGTTTAKD